MRDLLVSLGGRQSEPLSVPQFARLDEYVGMWMMRDVEFWAHYEALKRIDFAAHIRAMGDAPEPKSQVEILQSKSGGNIAFIPLLGTLMKQRSSTGGTSTIQARRDIRNAANDPNVSAILLGIDSPGGTVAGTQELADDVRSARRKKAVWAHVDDLTASAAYWVASQAEQIFANAPTALVGSIGTILTVNDESGAAEQQGIKVRVFSTGPLKGAGIPGASMTEEQATYFQGIVDGLQVHFDAGVKRGRGMNDTQLKAVKTGGVFHASQAMEMKLIDGIRPLEKTIEALAASAKARS